MLASFEENGKICLKNEKPNENGVATVSDSGHIIYLYAYSKENLLFEETEIH